MTYILKSAECISEVLDFLKRQDELQRVELRRTAAELAATRRELERWRHGVTIEGGFVCPRDLECDALHREIDQLKHAPPCNCDLTCEDFVTLNRLLCYLRDKHGCEAAWKETIAALARTIRVGEMKEDGHDPHR